MSYHILNIDTPDCSLSCTKGQLTFKTQQETKSLPIEDIASVIITSFSANIHSSVLTQAAKHGVSIILCDSFKPTSLVLPANRSTDTLLTRAWLELPDKFKSRLWNKTIDAKCENQFSLAKTLSPNSPALEPFSRMLSSGHPQRESICAKSFWSIYGAKANETNFTRKRDGGRLNDLLNYGYAVLLSVTLQKLYGLGLDPTFGIGHATRERSTPLAYDLMEPFRPFVDWKVAKWIEKNPNLELVVDKDFRTWVTSFPLDRAGYLNLDLKIDGCIEGVLRSFRRAVLQKQTRLYKPWIQPSSKWDG